MYFAIALDMNLIPQNHRFKEHIHTIQMFSNIFNLYKESNGTLKSVQTEKF